ncbi:hypothetical protein CsatB_016020 [Cannabis sativa]
MISEKKTANAMAGKTARACDSCLRKRARWFCAADDAFLCQSCDASVHSANQLASRHERVRLQTSSFKGINKISGEVNDSSSPAWLRGFTRKARTPRSNNKGKKKDEEVLPFVPEMSGNEGEDHYDDDDIPLLNYYDHQDDQQLLYQVPIFDPFAVELCNPINTIDDQDNDDDENDHNRQNHHHHHHHHLIESTVTHHVDDDDHHHQHDEHEVLGFLPSELELAEFAADVENLLGGGGGVEEEYCCEHEINGFGVIELLDNCKEEEEEEEEEKLNIKEENEDFFNNIKENNYNYKLDYDHNYNEMEEEGKIVNYNEKKKRKREMTSDVSLSLNLNYEGVIAAWATQGSPWTTGIRPQLNPAHGWPDHHHLNYMDMWRANTGHNNSGNLMIRGGGRRSNNEVGGGREARVSRYREKRRTRLFAKKIRYEVRKLNAEKRPRMKGRFVKRSSFMTNNNQLMMSTK